MNTKRFPRALTIASLTLLSTGCATTQKIADDAWTGTKQVVTTVARETSGAFQKLARYLKNAPLLRKHHDSANHDEKAVSDVLKKRPGSRRDVFPASYAGSYGWPLEAGIISSEYGPRWGHAHKGIDIAADNGEPILAAAEGVVIYAGDGLRGYGNVVILQHDAHTTTLYAHNSVLRAKVGDRVKTGETIALLGSTGHSTGPHCHFEIRYDGEAVDPRGKLARNRIFSSEVQVADAGKTRRAH